VRRTLRRRGDLRVRRHPVGSARGGKWRPGRKSSRLCSVRLNATRKKLRLTSPRTRHAPFFARAITS
jgi:hypothetical protein